MPGSSKSKCSICEKTFKNLDQHMPSCERKKNERAQELQFQQEMQDAETFKRHQAQSVQHPCNTTHQTMGEPTIAKRLKATAISTTRIFISSEWDLGDYLSVSSSQHTRTRQVHLSFSVSMRFMAFDAAARSAPNPSSFQTPESPTPSLIPTTSTTNSPDSRAPQADDIRTEYHPNSGRAARHDAFEEYRRQRRSKPASPDTPHPPWHPFESRADFDFAELALKCCLNQSQISAFLNLIQRCSKGDDTLHFKQYQDLADAWSAASHLLTPTTCTKVEAKYKKIDQTYDFYSRSLWEWALDLVTNPALAPFFEWDAQKLFKYDDKRGEWARFVNEPWTADRFYQVQSSLPEEGKPLCFIIYADKTVMSSFGGQKGHPVYARIANLPVSIRNGSEWSLGGGRLVGWLPIVKDADQGEGSNKTFVDFKRIVWHECFLKMFTASPDGKPSFSDLSVTGLWVACGDGVNRRLYPVIFILSADYEEQCVMANIRGANGKRPCPRCLIPQEQQIELSKEFEPRDHATTERMVIKASGMNLTQADEYLKPFGLRPVKNSFGVVANSDPFQSLMYDRLHTNHNGVGAKHLWVELRSHIEREYGAPRLLVLEDRASEFPRWGGLTHFNKVLSTKYQDGNKNEDLMKISLYLSFNIFPSSDKVGNQLLRCIRSYMNLDTLAGFTNHSEDTIQMIVDELAVFEAVLKEYIRLTKDDADRKDWNFPKLHQLSHLPGDIRAKGVTRNGNTKPNEAMHRLLKEFYLFMTNFKNFDGKILELEHWCYTAAFLRARINQHDGIGDLIDDDDGDVMPAAGCTEEEKGRRREDAPRNFGNITYRSADPKGASLAAFCEHYSTDGRFAPFRRLLQRFFSHHQAAIGHRVVVNEATVLREYHGIQAFYESMVTWETDSNTVRCSPLFYGRPRYDSVLFDDGSDTPAFGRLISLFTIEDTAIEDGALPLAFIEIFNGPVSTQKREQDRTLGLCRRLRQANPSSDGEEIEIPDFGDDDSDSDGAATRSGSPTDSIPSPDLNDDDEAVFSIPAPSDFATREEYLSFVKASQLALGKSVARIRELKLEIQTQATTIRQLKSRGKVSKDGARKEKRQVKKADESYAAELGRRFALLFELFLRKDAFLKERPVYDSLYPNRYKTSESRLRGQTAELYEALEESLHPSIARSPAFRDEFHEALLGRRKYSWNQLRSKTGSQIFAFLNPPTGIYIAKNGARRAAFQPFLDFLQFPADASNYRPLMFKDRTKEFSGLFRASWLPEVLRASLLGANSIVATAGSSPSTTPASNSSGKIWNIDCTTPGGMAYAIIATMYIHSPDESFGSVGSESGYQYERTFDFIKRLIVDGLRDTVDNQRGRSHMLETMEFWNDIVFCSVEEKSSGHGVFDDDVSTGLDALNALNALSLNDHDPDLILLSYAPPVLDHGHTPFPSTQQNLSASNSIAPAAPNTAETALDVSPNVQQEVVEPTNQQTEPSSCREPVQGRSQGKGRGRGRGHENAQAGQSGGPVRRSGRRTGK